MKRFHSLSKILQPFLSEISNFILIKKSAYQLSQNSDKIAMKLRLLCLSLCVLSFSSFVSTSKTEKDNEMDKSVPMKSAELVSLDSKNVVKVKKKKMKIDDQTKNLKLSE
jgi:hypothetical protein